MRLHRSESAFFVFMAVILTAAVLILYAYGLLITSGGKLFQPQQLETARYLARLIFAVGVLTATALILGMFLIYPLIRIQVREEGKLRAMTVSLSARSETLEQAALTDGLTGMQNRRYFNDALREYIEEFRRIQKPIGLMILDLDHFKQVNDAHGHDVGDDVLKAVAGCLRELTRYHDVVARLGGEEFAIVAPNMDEAQLHKFAERIRKAVAALSVPTGSTRLSITTSVGLATWDGRESADEYFRRADRRLYEAKRQGRNRVCA